MQTLYRFYDRDGRLLYIGITRNIHTRIDQHLARDWWRDVCRIDLARFPDRKSAVEAEKKAIREERPAFNVVYNDPEKVSAKPTFFTLSEKALIRVKEAQERRAQLLAEKERSGWTNVKLAKKHGVTVARMCQLLKAAREDRAQSA